MSSFLVVLCSFWGPADSVVCALRKGLTIYGGYAEDQCQGGVVCEARVFRVCVCSGGDDVVYVRSGDGYVVWGGGGGGAPVCSDGSVFCACDGVKQHPCF